MSDQYPAQYLEGLRLFNEGEFYECHDVLEELWAEVVGEEKKFYQGLIQAAVSLFHFGNGNLGGARKVHLSSVKYLEQYGDRYMGIDLANLVRELRHCFEELTACVEGYPDVELNESRIPEIAIPGERQDDDGLR